MQSERMTSYYIIIIIIILMRTMKFTNNKYNENDEFRIPRLNILTRTNIFFSQNFERKRTVVKKQKIKENKLNQTTCNIT